MPARRVKAAPGPQQQQRQHHPQQQQQQAQAAMQQATLLQQHPLPLLPVLQQLGQQPPLLVGVLLVG